MSTVLLGPSGSETTLPTLRWMGSRPPKLPVSNEKQIAEARMSDGTIRYAMFKRKQRFMLEWGYISLSDLDILKGLHALNQTLHFQNNFEDATWYDVIILSFSYAPVDTAMRQLGYYSCSMTLMEL